MRNGGGDDETSKQDIIKFVNSDGAVYKYEGPLNEGKPADGLGKLIKIKSKNYFGFSGSIKEPNGAYYEGQFKDGEPDGVFVKKYYDYVKDQVVVMKKADNTPITKAFRNGRMINLKAEHDALNPRR